MSQGGRIKEADDRSLAEVWRKFGGNLGQGGRSRASGAKKPGMKEREVLAVYQIVLEGNQVLREKSRPIPAINQAVIRLLDNLRDTLDSTETGVGLAAPQIGIPKQAFVIRTEEDGYMEMINPSILRAEGQEEGWEGCLSIPDMECLVPRATKILVRYLDRAGQERELAAEGYLARVIQHESDHLAGVLCVDRAKEITGK